LTARSLRVTIAAEHERRRRRTGSRNAAEILVLVTLRDARRSKRRLRRSTGWQRRRLAPWSRWGRRSG